MNRIDDKRDITQLPTAGMDALMRAEIDVQISTAHSYPRSLTRVARNVTDLVTMSEAAAAECMFSLPRGGKPIVGPSIRLAEVLFSQWGNCTGGSRTVEVNKTEGYVEAEGIFHDLETNAKTVKRTRRSIKGRTGAVYSDDLIIVTSNAAGAIAFRNAVLAGVPRAVWSEAYTKAEQTVRGDIKTLPQRRDDALKAMAAFGLSSDDVCKILGVAGHKDIGMEQLVCLTGLYNSLREGETDAEKLLKEAEGVKYNNIPVASKSSPGKPSKKMGGPEDPPAGEKEPEQPAEHEAEGPDYQAISNAILADLEEAPTPQAVRDFYKDQIEQIERNAPEAYAELEKSFSEKESS